MTPLAIGLAVSIVTEGADRDIAVDNNLELETGDNFLIETADFFLLET